MTFGMNAGPELRGSTGRGINTSSTGQFREKRPHGYSKASIQNYDPQQMELYQRNFGLVSPDSYLSKLAGGDQSFFDEMEAPALRQFSGIQGNIASRFSGMGGLGARKSSGFQNYLGEKSSNFAQDLAARRQGLQRQAILDLQGLSNDLLAQRPYEQFYAQKQQRQPSGWGAALGALGGAGAGFAAGGPYGAMQGANIGYQAFSGF